MAASPPKRAPKRETVTCRTRQAWRDWLQKHHRTAPEIWLVFDKAHTGRSCIGYEESVEEALCFGWVDSLITRLDDDRFARKFTPRKPDARWSAINKARYARVKKAGLLTEAGIARPPKGPDAVAPPLPSKVLASGAAAAAGDASSLPADIKKAFKANGAAWMHFERLSPSHRRRYIIWIEMAKRPETREKRLTEAVARLASGHTLGLK